MPAASTENGHPIFISAPRRSTTDGASTVSWTVDGQPVSIWSSDVDLADHQDVIAAPFALAGAHLGRPVVVEGELSRRLHRGLGRLATIHQSWFDTSTLDLRSDRLVRSKASGTSTALSFTCGIDSFHALLTRPQVPDTLLFVNGFDIEVGDHVRLGPAREGMAAVAAEVGAELVVVHTDLRRHPTFASIDWVRTHGAALAGIGHALEGHDRLVIASSWAVSGPEPWGSHFRTDHLLGTEALKVEHADAQANRFQKIQRLSRERLVQQHLRVCWENRVPSGNCGQCCKCAITEICLHHLGVLDDYETFPPVDDLVALAELDDIPRFRMVARSLLEDGLEEQLARPIRAGLERAGTPVPARVPVARQLFDRMVLAAHNR